MNGTLPPLLDSVVGGFTLERSLLYAYGSKFAVPGQESPFAYPFPQRNMWRSEICEEITFWGLIDQQSKSFLLAKTFIDSTLTVTPHKSLNFCRGIISEPDLLCISEAENLEGLSSQGVTQSRRITILRLNTFTYQTYNFYLQ
ncbi:hypothetical protein TNCV_4528611 [Trichonephila clavipes]|nr:hypothetical protein TNCV_4528611 [Trichonephila clavipes]